MPACSAGCAGDLPEKVISLKPQLDFRAATAMSRIIKQEDPFECIRCGKPFGVKSSVERVLAKLEGHWMFKDSKKRPRRHQDVRDCRVVAMAAESFDPFGAPARPNVRTTDDYLRERGWRAQGRELAHCRHHPRKRMIQVCT